MIFSLTNSGVVFHIFGSESARTGVAPAAIIEFREAINVSEGTITITTAGKAGINVPDDDKIFGYVVSTNAGLFIVASHLGIDDDDATGDNDWHSHSFTLDDDGCIATIDSAGTATLSGNTITIEGTDATSVDSGFFVMLKITEDSICVHKVFKQISFD